MEGLELTAFQIISSVGTARSCYIEAIQAAKKAGLLQKEASGEGNTVNLLILHAEDQLMSAEAFKTIALEFIDAYKRIEALEKKA